MQNLTGTNKVQQKVLQPLSSERPINDKGPLKEPVRKQTASGDNTQQNSQPLDQRGVESTEAASHVNTKAAEIRNLEEQYVSHCDRKAKLEERKEVSQQLETIRKFMPAPKDFDENCGFVITFVSSSGEEISVLPPDETLDGRRLGKLLGKLELLVGKSGETEKPGELEKAFGQDGKKLDESLKEVQEEINTTYTELKELVPNSEALNYTPEKARQYELTTVLPDWKASEVSETGSFVIRFDSPDSTPRAILKPDTTPEEGLTSEPDIFELPGIKNISPLQSDAPLFRPRGDKSQEATATIINGDADSELALPKSLNSTFLDEDYSKFQALHSTLLERVQGAGVMPDADLRKIAPACIRQCYCDKTGSMGTTFIHVFAENHIQSPYSSENRHNKVMVLWYPNKGVQITPESAKQANMEVMSALSRYQRKAFSYNDRPLDEDGPGLERDFAAYSQSKEHTESAESASLITNTRTGEKKKIKTKDPRKPSAYPVVTALRVGELPHEALLKRLPTTDEDNRALQGFKKALSDLPENRRFLTSLELPERFLPKEEDVKPSQSNPEISTDPNTSESVSIRLTKNYNLDTDIRSRVKKHVEKRQAKSTEVPENTDQPPQTQEQKDLHERRDRLQLFDESTALSILHLSKSGLQPNGPRTGVQAPTHKANRSFSIIPQSDDSDSNDVAMLILYVEDSTADSESVVKITKQFSDRLHTSLNGYIQEHGSLEGINDSTVINMIYAALPSPDDPSLKQTADFRIFLGINESSWILNRRDSGDMRTLCIPHNNPAIREIHADNKDPAIAKRLAQAIYKTDQVTQEQIEKAKRLPTISKLPALEDGGYYLLMERTALNKLMTEEEILNFINDKNGHHTTKDIASELKGELTKRWGGNPNNISQAGFEVINFSPDA